MVLRYVSSVGFIDLLEDRGELDGICRITFIDPDLYVLSDVKGTPIASSKDRDKLGAYALDLGAKWVRHDYDGSKGDSS